MQVFPATLAELVRDVAQRDGARSPLIFADYKARQLAPAAESRVVKLGH